MGFKKYTYVPAEGNTKAHYVDEEGKEVKGLKGTEPFKVYDEDKKEYLDYEHALAYLETIDDDDIVPDEENEVENVKEEIEKKPLFSEDGVKIINNNIINEEFENNNNEINNDKIINLKENDINDDEIIDTKENKINEEQSLPKKDVSINNNIISEKVENDGNEIIDDKIESKENKTINENKIVKEKINVEEVKESINDNKSYSIINKRDTACFRLLGLDPTKDYTKQTISPKQFQNTMKKAFQFGVFGGYYKDLRDDDGKLHLDAYPITEILSSMLRAFSYRSVTKDKDTEYYNNLKKHEKNQIIEEDNLEEINQLNEAEQSKALNAHNNVNGLLGEDNIYMKAGETDIPKDRKIKFLNEERDIYDPIEKIEFLESLQEGMIDAITGYDFPAASNIQFLDKKALKKGEYIYDDNALEKFKKEAFLSKEKAIEFIAEQIRTKDIQREWDNNKIINKNKKINCTDLYNSGLEKYDEKNKNGKIVKNAEFKHQIINNEINDSAISFAKEFNKSIINQLESYKKIENLMSYRSKFYGFWHPIESRKQKNILKNMRKEIENSLVPNTDFTKKIHECLDYKYNSNLLKNNLNIAKELNNTLENSNNKDTYINAFKDSIEIIDTPEDFYKDEVKNIENKIEKAEEKENVKVQEKVVEKDKNKELNNDIKEL